MILQAIYFKDKNRGKASSVIGATSSIGTIISMLTSGWLIANFGFWGVSGVCILLWALSLVCFLQMDERIKNTDYTTVKQCFESVLNKEQRTFLGIACGFQFVVIGSFVLCPLLLYLNTEDFQNMSFVAALAVLFQTALIILNGIWVDKSTNESPLRTALSINAAGLLLYAFVASSKWSLFIADSLQRSGFLLFMSTIWPRLHKAVRRDKAPLLKFGVVLHMQICFWELITLTLMGIAIYQIGEDALPYCFLACVLGSFAVYIYCKKMMKDKT